MKTELFKKVYIKSEADLPKEMGDYLVLRKTGYGTLLHFPFEGDVGWKADRYNWLHNVDWYLLPVSLPSDEEIEAEIHKQCTFRAGDEEYTNSLNERERIIGAQWMRDKLTAK